MSSESFHIQSIREALEKHFGNAPDIGVVLGSGWAEQADGLLGDIQRVPLTEFLGWPLPRVQGHSPELRMGTLEGKRVLLCGGRVHAYEGYEAKELVRGVRSLAAWGTSAILLLNAAGSLREDRAPGSLMPFADHINGSLPNPLCTDQTADGTTVFQNLVDLYDPTWRTELYQTQATLRPGVYVGLRGPSYETPAEVRYWQGQGADAVGMSTIPEAIAALTAGMKVMALSMMTNYAAGLGGSQPSHGEVLETAKKHGVPAAQALLAAVSVLSRAGKGKVKGK
jgi:inosine/guanosine/xanthosine phosphorylase family protein